jgi:tetratricopeptide (TPR) repeat protein
MRSSSFLTVPFVVGLLAACGSTPAVNQGVDRAAVNATPEPLFDGLGELHRPIETGSREAARYFDQGLRLLYAFNHDEARRSFQEAERLDPSCAMCFWGDALTLGPNLNKPMVPTDEAAAFDAANEAVDLSSNASAVSRALIAALALRYPTKATLDAAARKAADRAYGDAMRRIAAEFPDDDDVQTLFAESLMDLRPWDFWTPDGQAQPGTLAIVATLDRVLARSPLHPGANHYIIHAVEASPHPEHALDAARRLGALMPLAGHLVHMPAHIFERIGSYEEAAESNRRAIVADATYMALAQPSPSYRMYMGHNYFFLSEAAMMEGRSDEAILAARGGQQFVTAAMLRAMPSRGSTAALPVLALARFGRWDEVLAEPSPPADISIAVALWHYARGRALAARGDSAGAAREQAALDGIASATPADAPSGNSLARDVLAVASALLTGVREARSGDGERAVVSLRKAVTLADALRYDEPPDWYSAPRHTLGALLLAMGRSAEAAEVYRQDLARNPKNGWSLFGLKQALDALPGASKEAAAIATGVRDAWSHADIDLSASDFGVLLR